MVWQLEKRLRHAIQEQDSDNSRLKRTTFFIGSRHVKHQATKEFVEFNYVENPGFASEKDCRVFAQNSHVAIEVYDYYIKLFDPDYQTVSVYDERFDVQYLFKTKPSETWRSVDYYNPRIQVVSLKDGVEIKKVFDTDYGVDSLLVSYILRTGAFLKHEIVFTNKLAETKTFRVVMKLAGITSTKCKHKDGTDVMTTEKHIVSPFMFIGEDNQHLKLTEYFWSLGLIDEVTSKWSPTMLKDIVLDVHAQGMKADIVIGNYTLAQNGSLEIDPTTSTYTVGASSDDCFVRREPQVLSIGITTAQAGDSSGTYYDYETGMRWTVDIPQGASINSAYLKLVSNGRLGSIPTTIIEGEDTDDPATFSTFTNYDVRTRTSQSVNWTPSAWTDESTYTSGDISSIIQAIVNRVGFGTHIVLFWSHALGWGGTTSLLYASSWDGTAYDPPKLEVTWTVGVKVTRFLKPREGDARSRLRFSPSLKL